MSRESAAPRAAVHSAPGGADEIRPGRGRSAPFTILTALAICGAILAGYLAFENVQGQSGVCTGVAHSCALVQTSKYGKPFGIPVSLPGVLAYMALAVLGARARSSGGRIETIVAAYLAMAGVGVSAYLTGIEAFVLDAWCIYCVTSALLMTVLCLGWLAMLVTQERRPR